MSDAAIVTLAATAGSVIPVLVAMTYKRRRDFWIKTLFVAIFLLTIGSTIACAARAYRDSLAWALGIPVSIGVGALLLTLVVERVAPPPWK